MGKSIKRKVKLLVPEDQAAEVLRSVADGLETGSMGIDGGQMSLEGFADMDMSLKRTHEGMAVKIKIKFPAPEERGSAPDAPGAPDAGDAGDAQADDEDDGDDEDAEDEEDGEPPPPRGSQPKYSSLKKWMDKEFTAIREAVQAGGLPEANLAQSFVEDSRQMLLHAGKGDERYPAWQAATDALERAMADKDQARVASAVADLDALRHACHERYK